MKMEYFIKEIDGIFYKIYRDEEESNDEFYYRCNKISISKPKTEQEYKASILQSKILRNQKFLKLKYK